MAETKNSKAKTIHSRKWHIVWRSIIGSFDGLLALGGLTMITLGFISDYLPSKDSDNWTGNPQFTKAMKMDYRWFGFILLLASVLVMVIFFNVMAKSNEADKERELRRQERMKVLSASASEPLDGSKETAGAIEVDSSPVKK